MKKENILEVRNLEITFESKHGRVRAVQDVSFDVRKGEILAVVGESGCGKSVTGKAIIGTIQNKGKLGENTHIYFEGEDTMEYTQKQWESFRGDKCALIFQDALAALNPTLTVGRQIAEMLVIHRGMKYQAAMKEAVHMLEKVGIAYPEKRVKQYPHEFSGGMRQRVMIAMALVCNPDLLIADEPTTALDVTIQAQIMELLKKMQRENHTSMIMITHDLGIVSGMADRVLVMYAGKVMEQGTLRDIFYRNVHPYTKGLLHSVPRLDIKENEELESIPGTPPSLINPEPGCPFATRCAYCSKICREKQPPLHQIDEEHLAYCWMLEKGEGEAWKEKS